MIRLIIISFLTLLIAVSSPAETIRGRVLWVQDGDTVALTASNGLWFRVRLWGIDAPESDQPGGQAALTELIRLVGRKQVTVDIKDRDRYGRLVGVILYRKRDINLEMLRLGQAWHYRRTSAYGRKPIRGLRGSGVVSSGANRKSRMSFPKK